MRTTKNAPVTERATPATTPAVPEIELTFVPHADKPETKNCFRFDEVPTAGRPPRIGQLYVQKFALNGKQPARLIVKLSVPA